MLFRKLDDAELENILLRDPHSRSHRLRYLNQSATIGTSGHFSNTAASLLPCVKVIGQNDIGVSTSDSILGEGRFGTCYLHMLGHFEVCVKMFKSLDVSALTHEANILSRFFHQNLPYLFGVSVGATPSIITSYHGYMGCSMTIHHALFSKKSPEVRNSLVNDDWKDVLKHIITGLEHLHTIQKVLHNDLKGDNVLLTSTVRGSLGAVIVDFGKACETSRGRGYKLSSSQKIYYKLHHPHIAPDLRDGASIQSPSSDIYSLGRIIEAVNKSTSLNSDIVTKLAKDCMQYDGHLRPDAKSLIESLI